jgi:LytR cell envelope-related transcriptional attenuator
MRGYSTWTDDYRVHIRGYFPGMEPTPIPPEPTPRSAPSADDGAEPVSGGDPGGGRGPGARRGAGSAPPPGSAAPSGPAADRGTPPSGAGASNAVGATGAPTPHAEIGGRKFRVGTGDTYVPFRNRVRRRRRKIATISVTAAVLVGAAAYGVTSLVSPTHPAVAAAAKCATVRQQVPAAAQITVNVYNSTNRKGLAAATAVQLKQRGFTIGQVTNDPLKAHLTQAAQVRGGTTGQADMRVVAAEVPGTQYQADTRTDRSVDLVLGTAFTALASPAQVTAALAAAPGSPSPGACGHSAT